MFCRDDLYDQAIAECKKHIDLIDDQNSKIIIVLDDNKEWLEIIKAKTKGDDNIILISDTEKFRSFIHENGCSKMYIDINMGQVSGIDLAENLRLNECFGELVFVSDAEPNEENMERIKALESRYLSKGQLLDQIVYPKGGN